MSFHTTFLWREFRGAREEPKKRRKRRWKSFHTTLRASTRHFSLISVGLDAVPPMREQCRSTRHSWRANSVPHDFHTANLINMRLSIGFRGDRFYYAVNFIRSESESKLISPFVFFVPSNAARPSGLNFIFLGFEFLNSVLFFNCNNQFLFWFLSFTCNRI